VGEWRLAFGAFAVVAVMLAIAAAIALPSASGAPKAGGVPRLPGAVKRLIVSSFLMGAASTALWSFGGQLVAEQMAWGPKGIGMLWTCIGVGGVAGAWAGALVNRFGLDSIHRSFLGLMSATILATGAGIGAIPALLGGVLFGAAYVMLTGVYLIWGTNALPDRPATGLMIGFLTIAIGQTAGAPLFGFLLEWNGPETAVICFALVTALAGMFRARRAHVRVPA
jgi:predicted MFS family arabinose efflux permease